MARSRVIRVTQQVSTQTGTFLNDGGQEVAHRLGVRRMKFYSRENSVISGCAWCLMQQEIDRPRSLPQTRDYLGAL